jgi:hypothetical protein
MQIYITLSTHDKEMKRTRNTERVQWLGTILNRHYLQFFTRMLFIRDFEKEFERQKRKKDAKKVGLRSILDKARRILYKRCRFLIITFKQLSVFKGLLTYWFL